AEYFLPNGAGETSRLVCTPIPLDILPVLLDVVEQLIDQLAGAFRGLPAFLQLGLEACDLVALPVDDVLPEAHFLFQEAGEIIQALLKRLPFLCILTLIADRIKHRRDFNFYTGGDRS